VHGEIQKTIALPRQRPRLSSLRQLTNFQVTILSSVAITSPASASPPEWRQAGRAVNLDPATPLEFMAISSSSKSCAR